MEIIFLQIALMLSVAFAFSYIAKFFKQPLILGYIVAGIILSPLLIKTGSSTEIIQTFSKFGIAFLLFIVGLHLNPKVLKEIGIASAGIGISQMILTFGISFILCIILGFSTIISAYVGIALMFSSTIIAMKLLSDKKDLDSLYGKISTGILIIQDLAAIIILMVISYISNNSSISAFNITNLVEIIISGGVLILISIFILPRFTNSLAKSQEMLFIFSIAWCFSIGVLFNYLGLSIEIGALLAGISLSISPYSVEISSKIRPLRDFFLVTFFIILGMGIKFGNLMPVLAYAGIFSLIVLIIKPISLMIISSLFGYTKRTNFFVGITLSQISEFSLILIIFGMSSGYVSEVIVQSVTLCMIITMLVSTYFITYSGKIYEKMKGFASLFERKSATSRNQKSKKYDTVLFGYNRVGFSILRALKESKKSYMVVDFNPDTIKNLERFNVPCIYGDVEDEDFLGELPLEKARLIVSTVPEYETNLLLMKYIKKINKKAVVILRSDSVEEAYELYEEGADYVLTPHLLGGEYVSKMIGESKTKDYLKEKERHIEILSNILKKKKI